MTRNWDKKPGSDAAIAAGCTCPILDNAYGRGRGGLGLQWVIDDGCGLHGGIDR